MRAVIFDFDGVIADTEPLHFEGLRRTLAEIRITLTEKDYYTDYLGFDDRGCILEALRVNHRPIASSLVEDLMAKKAVAYMASMKEHLVIFPGVKTFIEEAAAAYPLAIASGALRPEIELVLEQIGIRKAFAHITSAEDVANGKPHPEPFLQALAGLNRRQSMSAIPAGSCLVIEDSRPGIRAAKAAGMRVLAVANTHTVQDLHEADAISLNLSDTRLDELRTRLWQA
ncbi:MAG: HAD family phosphatase [Nitrospira sp.]|nr:HAD family phosphatase [Nitrospira sp.]MDH4302641.1 HAD family phosphatase [Nitrospira sp.]MDH5193498.1 HAD family phosphatase [Nitrospira sp.]